MNKLFFILAIICIAVGYNQINIYYDVFNASVAGFLAVFFLYCGAVSTIIKNNKIQ